MVHTVVPIVVPGNDDCQQAHGAVSSTPHGRLSYPMLSPYLVCFGSFDSWSRGSWCIQQSHDYNAGEQSRGHADAKSVCLGCFLQLRPNPVLVLGALGSERQRVACECQ